MCISLWSSALFPSGAVRNLNSPYIHFLHANISRTGPGNSTEINKGDRVSCCRRQWLPSPPSKPVVSLLSFCAKRLCKREGNQTTATRCGLNKQNSTAFSWSNWSCNLYLKGKVQLNLALTKETRYDNPSVNPEKWRTLCSYARNRQTADPNQSLITLKMAER